MRTLHDHQVNPANDSLTIRVTDEPGSGGANHEYEIELAKPCTCAREGGGHAAGCPAPSAEARVTRLSFQNGPIAEVGVNGVTHEALLAIVVDRLQSFQAGPYACRENALALTHLQDAQHWLNHRTRARMARGVEGTHQK